jgi:hypothetical protein
VADLRAFAWILAQGDSDLDHDQLTVELPYTRNALRTIQRLVAAGLLRDDEDELQVPPIASIFAVTRLIAIEAKVKEPSRGLIQAARNGWFASETYLLTERAVNGGLLVKRARLLGVGLVGRSDLLSKAPLMPERRPMRASYATWLFNEWVWRAALHAKSSL